MTRRAAFSVAVCAASVWIVTSHVVGHAGAQLGSAAAAGSVKPPDAAGTALSGLESVTASADARRQDDFAALETFRPGYPFWQHIFTIPDGSIAFGSAVDGRLLGVFPVKGDWAAEGGWEDPTLEDTLAGEPLARRLDDRRDQAAQRLEQAAGPVLHNLTRGRFLLPNVPRYGGFLQEWGAIYERFGVPADIGLAQAIVESGLNGRRRSEARAVGFCQWLDRNWKRLDGLAPPVLEIYNQTTQAPYCAAYLTILAIKYGSFIPALSEHHTGGTNVGRTLINGARLGGEDIRERYFLGAQLARDLRTMTPRRYRDVYGTYGPRSYYYAEMVFGNTITVRNLMASTPQVPIQAMRTERPIALAEIVRRTRLTADEVRRFNPALVKRVPARATLYLPVSVKEFGRDVAFWRRPPSAAYASALQDFIRLEATAEQWDDRSFEPVLRGFERRFSATKTEEGTVMAATLSYVIDEMYRSRRGAILAEFRTSDDVRRLFEHAVAERDASRTVQAEQ